MFNSNRSSFQKYDPIWSGKCLSNLFDIAADSAWHVDKRRLHLPFFCFFTIKLVRRKNGLEARPCNSETPALMPLDRTSEQDLLHVFRQIRCPERRAWRRGSSLCKLAVVSASRRHATTVWGKRKAWGAKNYQKHQYMQEQSGLFCVKRLLDEKQNLMLSSKSQKRDDAE